MCKTSGAHSLKGFEIGTHPHYEVLRYSLYITMLLRLYDLFRNTYFGITIINIICDHAAHSRHFVFVFPNRNEVLEFSDFPKFYSFSAHLGLSDPEIPKSFFFY